MNRLSRVLQSDRSLTAVINISVEHEKDTNGHITGIVISENGTVIDTMMGDFCKLPLLNNGILDDIVDMLIDQEKEFAMCHPRMVKIHVRSTDLTIVYPI